MMKRRYGWRPDLPDHRDDVFGVAPHLFLDLPALLDLRPDCPPVYDQLDTQSCTGNAGAFLVHFDLLREHGISAAPSRLFPYYNARLLEEAEDVDGGASFRDIFRGLAQKGICSEERWPFDPDKVTTRPSDEAYADAAQMLISKYSRVFQSADLIRVILSQGLPVGCGISVYESLESDQVASSGVIPLPGPDESRLGGHAIALVGADHKRQMFFVRNSWGDRWGMDGYAEIPYPYILRHDLARDFWMIQTV